MKSARHIIGSLLFLALTALSGLAQEFTLTTTKANITSNRASINMPGLSGNPLAIIVATPLGDTELLNPNPLGAWYYAEKWNINNTNGAVMPPGAKYRIQFFLRPGANQFLHVVTKENLGSEGSYIDSPSLNNNPNAQVQILQNHAPDVRSPYNVNRFEARAAYSSAAGRWYIANVNGEPLGRASAYNVVVGLATVGANTNTNTNSSGPIPVTPTPRTGDAGNNPGGTVVPNTNTLIGKPTSTGRMPVLPAPTPIPTPAPIPTPPILKGFVDMHTHPMSHLGFGKRLLHGAPDGGVGLDNKPNGSIVPAGTLNCNPTDFRASNVFDALGNCNSTHGGWNVVNNGCGDTLRSLVISNLFDSQFVHKLGLDHRHQGIETTPQFLYFPHQTSKVHQQMWWEWIKRAKELGDLRVMVALTVNSELLAKILNGSSPVDDKASADLQIDEITSFVKRHDDFMEIAKTPADLRRIVGEDKLAVVLGMEVDNIGNFNQPGAVVTEAAVKAELNRLHAKGVRYIFPIHLVNNQFGGTAVYEDLFNFANKYSTGSFYKVHESDGVVYRLGVKSDIGVFLSTNQDIRPILDGMAFTPYPPAFDANPTSPDFCVHPAIPFNGRLGCFKTFKLLKGVLNPPSEYQIYDMIPKGHVNDAGLTSLGRFAVLEMMKLGMLIDIDHMSDRSQADILEIAERPGNNYPLNIGHNGLQNRRSSERIASVNTVKRIAALGGVFGVGTADSDEHPYDAQTFISSFNEVWVAMGGDSYGAVAIGTDVNGMERLPRASQNLNSNQFYTGFPRARTGSRGWDYTTEGVAHYGLMADFLRDVKERSPSVHQNLMNSAEHFARMWEKAEKQKASVK